MWSRVWAKTVQVFLNFSGYNRPSYPSCVLQIRNATCLHHTGKLLLAKKLILLLLAQLSVQNLLDNNLIKYVLNKNLSMLYNQSRLFLFLAALEMIDCVWTHSISCMNFLYFWVSGLCSLFFIYLKIVRLGW